jgi:regulator of replication initiation timing
MADKISELEDRVAQVLKLVEQLRKENGNLKRQNKEAASELTELRRRYHELSVDAKDKAATVRSRLTSVLNRIEELERLGS